MYRLTLIPGVYKLHIPEEGWFMPGGREPYLGRELEEP
jgi:hypothetical protein